MGSAGRQAAKAPSLTTHAHVHLGCASPREVGGSCAPDPPSCSRLARMGVAGCRAPGAPGVSPHSPLTQPCASGGRRCADCPPSPASFPAVRNCGTSNLRSAPAMPGAGAGGLMIGRRRRRRRSCRPSPRAPYRDVDPTSREWLRKGASWIRKAHAKLPCAQAHPFLSCRSRGTHRCLRLKARSEP